MAYTDDPEDVLRDVWSRVENTQPPVADPPGREWQFATGALLAFGSIGALTKEQIPAWEKGAQREAQRLRESSLERADEPQWLAVSQTDDRRLEAKGRRLQGHMNRTTCDEKISPS